jgi:hypothetical protein
VTYANRLYDSRSKLASTGARAVPVLGCIALAA